MVRKYKDMILYIFFGGCTTIVNLIIYYLCTRQFGLEVTTSTVLAWWVAVIFAYITNRTMVFHSKNRSFASIAAEFVFFVGCRLLTGFLDVLLMYCFVTLLHYPDLIMKIISNLLVILLNYAASRLFIFRQHANRR